MNFYILLIILSVLGFNADPAKAEVTYNQKQLRHYVALSELAEESSAECYSELKQKKNKIDLPETCSKADHYIRKIKTEGYLNNISPRLREDERLLLDRGNAAMEKSVENIKKIKLLMR